jgi:hypothetical protein
LPRGSARKNMETILRLFMVAAALLAGSCSSVSPPTVVEVPGEVRFNPGAGRGEALCVILRRPNGEAWKFIVDTGAPDTMLDRSLEPQLGPLLGHGQANYGWFGQRPVKVFAAPRLSLGGLPLRTGARVFTDDFARLFPRRQVQGILGMDCLRNYVVQLDFGGGKMRLLDPTRPPGGTLGQPYRLRTSSGALYIESDFFGTGRAAFQVDTGCTIDAVLERRLFEQVLLSHRPVRSRTFSSPAGRPVQECVFAQGTFDGTTYSRLLVDGADDNLLGLRFLARHGVTFDFPRDTLFLRR